MIVSISYVGTAEDAEMTIEPGGVPGPTGPAPEHGWSGTQLRFKLPNGSWGGYVDLRGPAPEHQWTGTSLKFKLPNDTWGASVDLKGDTGSPGLSAYQVAVANGFSGDETAWLASLDGDDGDDGDDGTDGWTPVEALIADGDRIVKQIADWVGGTGAKPATGKYVGAAGLVDAIVDAVDTRGAPGLGSGDVTAATAFGADNRLVRSDGTGKGVQASGVTLSDDGDLSGIRHLSISGALTLDGAESVASAATCSIGAATSNTVTITGTTTITSLGTAAAGVWRLVRFAGALTLTHNGTSLILPGAASIVTAAGDTALMVSEGSGNWRCHYYQRGSGKPVSGGGGSWEQIGATQNLTSGKSKAITSIPVSERLMIEVTGVQATSSTDLFGVIIWFSTDNGATYTDVTGFGDYISDDDVVDMQIVIEQCNHDLSTVFSAGRGRTEGNQLFSYTSAQLFYHPGVAINAVRVGISNPDDASFSGGGTFKLFGA